MNSLITYSIGDPYPHKDHHPGKAEIYAVTDHSFFHIVYYCSQPELDSMAWQKGKLLYGLYIAYDVPFFLVSFPDNGLAFEVTINAYVIDDEYIDNWLNNERTLIPMLLIDAYSNSIKAVRVLSIKSIIAQQIRDCLERQDARYSDKLTVERTIDRITQSTPTRTMLAKATLQAT